MIRQVDVQLQIDVNCIQGSEERVKPRTQPIYDALFDFGVALEKQLEGSVQRNGQVDIKY